MSDYQPGTVAVISADFGDNGFTNVRGLRIDHGWATEHGETMDRYVTDVRPLVVLDLDAANPRASRELKLAHLVKVLREDERFISNRELADQIEQQTKPPKPEEPTTPGSLVKDRDGVLWAKTAWGLWTDLYYMSRDKKWCDIDTVKVLSEGVKDE